MATTNMTGVRQQAERVANTANRKVGDWTDQAQEMASDVADRAGDAYDYARDRAGDAYDMSRTFVREHPMPTVLAALGIGVLIGAVCWRSR